MKIDIFYVILGIFIGVFAVYVMSPVPRVIFKYPTLENITNTTYVDDQNFCYKYYAKEIPC